MRSPSDFQAAAATHHIARWDIHDCSICGEWVGFVFQGDAVGFDSLCDCSSYVTPVRRCDWQELADYYNLQTAPAVIAKMDAFWHFVEPEVDNGPKAQL